MINCLLSSGFLLDLSIGVLTWSCAHPQHSRWVRIHTWSPSWKLCLSLLLVVMTPLVFAWLTLNFTRCTSLSCLFRTQHAEWLELTSIGPLSFCPNATSAGVNPVLSCYVMFRGKGNFRSYLFLCWWCKLKPTIAEQVSRSSPPGRNVLSNWYHSGDFRNCQIGSILSM